MSKIPVKNSSVDRNSQFIALFGDPMTANTVKVPFSEYASVSGGFAFKSKEFIADAIPIIRITNIEKGNVFLDYQVCYPTSFPCENEQYLVKKGDILMAMSGATTGKAGLYRIDAPALLNQRVACIRTIPQKSSTGFVYALTQMDWFYTLVQNAAEGGAQPNISLRQIASILVPYAPYQKQEEFAAFVQQSDKSKFAALSVSNLNLSHCLEIRLRTLSTH